MKSSILFAHGEIQADAARSGFVWTDFMPDARTTRLHDPDLPVFEVEVTEDERGDHFAWWDSRDRAFTFVSAHESGIRLCFPCDLAAHIGAGEGLILRVRLEERGVVDFTRVT